MSLTITLPQKIVPLCTSMGLKADHERAVAAFEDAKRLTAGDAREGSTVIRDAAQAIHDIETEMRDHTVEFTLRAWPRKRWAEFEETHKPREGREDDKAYSIDLSSLDVVISGAVVAVKSRDGADIPFIPATDWQPLADEMTSGQWEDFALAILALNRGTKAAPFNSAASRVIQKSEPSSN